jgi:hypothetical protein
MGDKVTNGDMEAGTASFDESDVTVDCTYAQDAGQAHGGSYSAKITRTASGSGRFYHRFRDLDNSTAENGKTYRCSMWIYLPSGQTLANVQIYFDDGATGNVEKASVTDTDSWVNVLLNVTAGTEFELMIRGQNGDQNDYFYLDDVKIIEVPVLTNHDYITATGDYSTDNCYLGLDYEARYRLSEQFVRTGEKHSESITEGKLHLQFATVVFHQSGSFKVQVLPHESLDTNEYVHTVVLGSQQATIGEAFISSGQLKFPVLANSSECTIDLVNDAYLPSSWQAVEWEGIHVIHTQRN